MVLYLCYTIGMNFNCENPPCGKTSYARPAEYARKKHHFCSRKCYSEYRRDVLPTEQQNAFQGGITPEESRRRWAAKNKKVLAIRAAKRKERELNAPGSHTKKEWLEVKALGCAEEDETCKGDITKDHEIPLIMGGSDDINNIQGLCRSHNSRKSTKVYLGNFEVKGKNEL